MTQGDTTAPVTRRTQAPVEDLARSLGGGEETARMLETVVGLNRVTMSVTVDCRRPDGTDEQSFLQTSPTAVLFERTTAFYADNHTLIAEAVVTLVCDRVGEESSSQTVRMVPQADILPILRDSVPGREENANPSEHRAAIVNKTHVVGAITLRGYRQAFQVSATPQLRR